MIFISVPHGFCLDAIIPARHCDRLAQKAAVSLAESLHSKKMKTYTILPTTIRAVCDLNRSQCVDTNYRTGLRNFVKAHYKEIVFTLDVHSFPKDTEDWEKFDFVILDNLSSVMKTKGEFTDYALSLYKYCKTKGIPTKLVEGAENSIQDELRARGFKNLLIEFKESLSESELKMITDTVADWIVENYGP